MTSRQKIDDVILAARNVSIVLSFFSRVSVAKLNFHANVWEFSDIADFRTFGADCRENSHHTGTSLRSVKLFFVFNVREKAQYTYIWSFKTIAQFWAQKSAVVDPPLCYWGVSKTLCYPPLNGLISCKYSLEGLISKMSHAAKTFSEKLPKRAHYLVTKAFWWVNFFKNPGGSQSRLGRGISTRGTNLCRVFEKNLPQRDPPPEGGTSHRLFWGLSFSVA